MVKMYGAPIDEEKQKLIVDYLMTIRGVRIRRSRRRPPNETLLHSISIVALLAASVEGSTFAASSEAQESDKSQCRWWWRMVCMRADEQVDARASCLRRCSVFIEKYITKPRHIEFQIFGDKQGMLFIFLNASVPYNEDTRRL